MAIIENIQSGEKIVLRSHHVFGRHASITDTVLTHPEISNIHASTRWDGERWTLKDHSLNGTWLGNQRVLKNRDIELEIGQLLSFGSPDNAIWQVQHLNEPADILIALDEEEFDIVLNRFQVLPSEQSPEVTLYVTESGQWICEQDDKSFGLNNGESIRVSDGRQWRLFLQNNTDFTVDSSTNAVTNTDNFNCYFNVSADEEHVFLKIEFDEHEFDLEERVHHYLLLLLARQREQDRNKDFDVASQGWMYLDDLCGMLGVTISHLYILIFRVRKQVQQVLADLPFVPQPIERRQGSIRFGFSCFHYS